MFQNSSAYKKQDKICSISNFSSSENSQYLNEQEIAAQARSFANQLKRHEQKRFHKPVFIITPELTAKHINALTQIFEKNRVPIQYQHQTQSLGLQLNTRFFVVVDNKNGTQILGKQFNSPLMTIVGYPKIGNNKQNIYCQYAEDVFHQYKEFVNANSKPVLASGKDYQLVQGSQFRDKQPKQQSLMKNSGPSGFSSILRPNLSGLKLKSISKYDRQKRQVGRKKFSYNKQNITSINDIHTNSPHNLYFLQSLENQPFNNMIGRHYHEIKLNTAKNIEETTFYFRAEADLVRKLNEFNPSNSKKSFKKIPNDKLHYVLVSAESALRLATRIQCEFYAFKDKIRLIVAMLNKENPVQENDDEDNHNKASMQKQMLLVKKTIQSNIFQSLVFSQQQCQKMLKSVGFKFNHEIPQIKVGPNECKSILTKSHKKINGTTERKIKIEADTPISEDMISFCPKLKNTVHINEESNLNHTLRSQSMTVVTQKTQKDRENNLMSKVQIFTNQPNVSQQNVQQPQLPQTPQFVHESSFSQTQQFTPQPHQFTESQQFPKHQSALSPSKSKPKIVIPPINSILSPQKSTVSSTGSKTSSKIKIIKVIKKQPQNKSDSNTLSKPQDRGKSISQVNSEYCLNKNKSIVEKMQSKMALSNSRPKLQSKKQIDSLKSIENHFNSQEKILTQNANNLGYGKSPQSRGSIQSSQKSLSNPSKFQNLRDSNAITATRFGHQNQPDSYIDSRQKYGYDNEPITYPDCKKGLSYNNESIKTTNPKKVLGYNNQSASMTVPDSKRFLGDYNQSIGSPQSNQVLGYGANQSIVSPDTRRVFGHNKTQSASASFYSPDSKQNLEYQTQSISSPSPNKKQFKKIKINLHTEQPFVARCSQVTIPDDQESQHSYKNIRKLKKSVKKDTHDPVSVSEYYFGPKTQTNQQFKKSKPFNVKPQNFINGLLHVEYNEFIGMIVNQFKKNCPSSIIKKESYKPFYLACEYSKQIKKLWKNTKERGILPSLVDIQGLREICKYYANVMYEDDEVQFCQTVESQLNKNDSKFFGNQTFTPNSSDQNPHMLLFFTIVTQKQVDDKVFQRLDWIAERLPRHEIIKCVIEENLSDKQMREKANQIYTQMVGYFTELKEEYGQRFVQTV